MKERMHDGPPAFPRSGPAAVLDTICQRHALEDASHWIYRHVLVVMASLSYGTGCTSLHRLAANAHKMIRPLLLCMIHRTLIEATDRSEYAGKGLVEF